MEIELTCLLKELEKHNPELCVSQEEKILIKAVKLLEKDQCFFDPNYLYIGKISNLPNLLPQNNIINLLCPTNKNLTPKYKNDSILNLILLNTNVDIARIFNEVQEILTNKQQLAINSSKLLDALVSGKGMEHIVNACSEILKNPVCVMDLSFKVTAHSKSIKVDNPIWIELLTKGYCSFDFVSMSNVEKFIELVHKSDSPIFMSKDKFRIPRIISNIKISNKVVGYVASLECEKPFAKNDMDLIFVLCKVLSCEAQKSNFMQNTKGLRYEHFIIDLLRSKKMDKGTIGERLKFLNLNFKDNLYVLTIAVPENNFVNIPLHKIRDYIDYMIVDSKSIIYNNAVVVLINCNSKLSYTEKIFIKLTAFLQENKIYGGLSRCFHNLADMKDYYEQSISSIKLGIKLKTNKSFFLYEDLAIYHLLGTCSSQNNLKSFCHDSIFSLIDYDIKNNTDYMKNLHTYLINGKNQLETANILNICRSTLAHRIEKIQQIMDINLNDSTITFRLFLTFLILEYIDKTKSTDEVYVNKKSIDYKCI